MPISQRAIEVHSLIFCPYNDPTTELKNTYDDWLLLPSKKPVIVLPPVRTNFVEVMGMNGTLDASGILDTSTQVYENKKPTYGMRESSIEFYIPEYKQNVTFESLKRSIASFLHGKNLSVKLASDPNYYYRGRWEVNEAHTDEHWSMITIDYHLEPPAYSVSNPGVDTGTL